MIASTAFCLQAEKKGWVVGYGRDKTACNMVAAKYVRPKRDVPFFKFEADVRTLNEAMEITEKVMKLVDRHVKEGEG